MNNKVHHKILIVDDDERILKSLKRLLNGNFDADIFLADGGERALELVKAERPTLIISDQRMPGMTGVEFLKKSRKISPGSIRILLTGYADIEATVKAINDGAVKYYFNKPWNDDELILRIRESFHIHELVKENNRLNALAKSRNEELKKLNESLAEKVNRQTVEIKKQNEQIRRSMMETIQALSTIVEIRHRDVGSHSQRVANIAKEMLKYSELPEEEQQAIIIAAFLHDIGKISLPDHIMKKNPAEYSRQDLTEVEQHPILGKSCVLSVSGFEEIGTIIYHHHEDFDGNGYPNGLSGDQIPLGSRIIRLADAFEHNAFSSGYPTSRDLKEAAADLVKNSGTYFDPMLVKKFIENEIGNVFSLKEETDITTLRPSSLKTDMVIAEDIYSRSGMFLLPKGARLSPGMITRIIKIDRFDPIENGVEVYRHKVEKEAGHAVI